MAALQMRPMIGRTAASRRCDPVAWLAAVPMAASCVPWHASCGDRRRETAPVGERHRSLADALASFSAKRLARAADTHPKTAARWRRGEAAPSGDAVMRMMATDDELLAALLRAAGRDERASLAAAERHMAEAIKHLNERR